MSKPNRKTLQAGFAAAAGTILPSAPSPALSPEVEGSTTEAQIPEAVGGRRGRPKTDRNKVRSSGQPMLIHLNKEFHEALKIACIKTRRRMQDEILRWIEDGARKAGFREKVRVDLK